MRSLNQIYKIMLPGIVALCCSSCGPHMIIQPSIKPYRQRMPKMPTNTVPTQGRIETLTAIQSKITKNPIPQNAANLHNGKLYYEYYCLMCHGKYGDGNGPVGQSFVPKPTNLASPKIKAMNDGQLYKSMLLGLGHDPVMIQTVLPNQRWPLVMYVRSFGKDARKRELSEGFTLRLP